MRVSKIAVNCNLDRGYNWAGGKGQQQPNQRLAPPAPGWHAFSMNFIAADVTLID
jgi:hypothetical protein